LRLMTSLTFEWVQHAFSPNCANSRSDGLQTPRALA